MAAGAVFGQINFSSMGDKSKFLFPSMGLFHILVIRKNNFVILVVQMEPWGFQARFRAKKGCFQINSHKIEVSQLFKTYFPPVGRQNIVDIEIRKFCERKCKKRVLKSFKKKSFEKASFFFFDKKFYEWFQRHKFGLKMTGERLGRGNRAKT